MKKMKLVLAILIMAIGAKAQVYVQGGINLANITQTNSGGTDKSNLLTTFNVGVLSRFGLSSTFDLESGILLSGRGSKTERYFGDNNYVKAKFNPLYLEVPLNAIVKIPLDAKNTSSIFFNAGPYIAVGVGGKSTRDNLIGGIQSSSSSNIQFSNDNPFTSQQDDANYAKLKRFDYGLNFGGGIDFGKFLLKANYGFGLSKINSTQTNNTVNDNNKYRTFSISAGIPLNRK